MMEIVQELSGQYVLYIPVALVVIVATLVFAFGFKSAEQPPFDKLSSEDRKSTVKKRKIKDKKSTANGHITTAETKNDKSPAKKSPVKESDKQEKKEKKADKQPEKPKKIIKDLKPSTKEDVKENKKTLKKLLSEKPKDFDEGDWEIVPSKGDKKKKGDQSPTIKEKKHKKNEKVDKSGNDKIETVEAEKESEIEEIAEESAKAEELLKTREVAPVIEEKKDKKKKEKKPKKDNNEKPVTETKDVSLTVQPKVEKVETSIKKIESSKSVEPKKEDKKAAPVFDELGDTWTEAKAPKKTAKKKPRRDN